MNEGEGTTGSDEGEAINYPNTTRTPKQEEADTTAIKWWKSKH